MAKKRSLIQRLPLDPVFAAMFGVAAAVLVAATPQWLFESTVVSSGIAKALSVAQPPLGIKARLLAIFVAFALAAVIGWAVGGGVERLLFGPRQPKPVIEDEDDNELDLSHFAKATPAVETPRRPIFADRELGAPLMSDEALATGALLAEPFPAFDPTPFEDTPVEDELFAEPMRAEAPLPVLEAPEPPEPELPVSKPAPVEDPVLHAPLALEEFDVPAAPEEPETLPGESSIDALIRRLEAGIARRAGPPPPHPGAPAAAPPAADPRDWMVRSPDAGSFDEDTTRALGTLRRMAG